MEKKIVKPLSVTSKIVSISLGDFKVAVIDKSAKSKLDKEKFSFEFNISIKLDPKSKQVNLVSTIKIYSDITKKVFLGEIESIGAFLVENYAEIIKENKGGMPNIIISMFVGVLISTTRGFLILQSKGTIVEDAIIPMINPLELFKNSFGDALVTKG